MEAIYSNILEINPQKLFSIMKEDIYKNYPIITLLNINKDYIEIRSQLINLIHSLSKKMGFKLNNSNINNHNFKLEYNTMIPQYCLMKS